MGLEGWTGVKRLGEEASCVMQEAGLNANTGGQASTSVTVQGGEQELRRV